MTTEKELPQSTVDQIEGENYRESEDEDYNDEAQGKL